MHCIITKIGNLIYSRLEALKRNKYREKRCIKVKQRTLVEI